MKYAVAVLIGATQAAKITGEILPPAYINTILKNPTPWDKDTLQACPEDATRNILDDAQTHVVKWPLVGATCALQITDDVTLTMLGNGADPAPAATPETGKKAAPKAPKAPEVPVGAPNLDHLEHCPDFNERYTLRNGTTAAVPYPKTGFNCNPAWSLVQTPWAANVVPANIPVPAASAYPAGLEHCPDQPERQTLRNGQTKPIAFPAKGYNCTPDVYPGKAGVPFPYALSQKDAPWPANVVPANIPVPAGSAYPAGLEHCPDRPERQTITGGIIRAVPFPTKGYNCMPDIYPGKTGFPSPYALQQLNAPWPANVVPANIPVPAASAYPAGLEHCPDRPERQTLRNGQTKPIPFPAKGANCIPDIHPGVEGVPAPYH